MNCPFPGMDPYIERPDLWPDFHGSLIVAIKEVLQPALKPRYVAKTEDRMVIQETDRDLVSDVAIRARPRGRPSGAGGGVATLAVPAAAVDTAVIVEFDAEEFREPLLHVVEAATGRVVAAVEVLSPANKTPGASRKKYLESRAELVAAGVHLVEIDLLREGQRAFPVPEGRQAKLEASAGGPWRYLVSVTRFRPERPTRQELYPFRLQAPLPRVALPLDPEVPDVALDLPSAFARVWNGGPYPELLRYDGDPMGPLSDEERVWCGERLATLRSGT